MNKRSMLAALAIACAIASSPVLAEVRIPDAAKAQIASVLSKPVQVFQLDQEQAKKELQAMDSWFGGYMGRPKERSHGQRTTLRAQLSGRTAILANGQRGRGVGEGKPVTAWYTKEPQKRSFALDLQVPTSKSIPDEDATRIAAAFITAHGFSRFTDRDRLGAPLIVSRKVRAVGSEARAATPLTLSRRVQFRREFSGLEVINSKQIVEIHPDSREILAYKSIRWTPVDERSGRTAAYISEGDVLARIEKAFAAGGDCEVTKVKAALAQTDQALLPVLAVYTRPLTGRTDGAPMNRVLVVSLVRDVGAAGAKREPTLPTAAPAAR